MTSFGAPAMADNGQLVTVLAGPKAAVDMVKPYTKGVIARADIDLSDQKHSKATLLKVIGNTFILQMVEALSEGHTVAEKTGLGCEDLHQFIEVCAIWRFTCCSVKLTSSGRRCFPVRIRRTLSAC